MHIISKITYWPAFIQVNRSVQSFVLNTVNLFKIAQITFLNSRWRVCCKLKHHVMCILLM